MGTYYCDWENGAAHPTGDGSSLNPYRSIDDVFNNKTQDVDTTIYLSGNQLEVRTSEISSAMTSAGWSLSAAYLLTLIGTDGSSTGFDGNGSYSIVDSLSSGGSIIAINVEITNSGTNVLWKQSTGASYASGLLNCYLHNSSATTTPVVTSTLVGCRLENLGSGNIYAVNANMFNCFLNCNGADYGATGAGLYFGNMLILNGSSTASQEIGFNVNADGVQVNQNTIYRATGATKKAWGIFVGSARESLHLQGNLFVYADSVAGDVGVYGQSDHSYTHNCGFHNVADHVFNVSHIVGDPGLQSVTIASNPFSSTPTATYSSWEPTSTGIDGLRGTATGNQGYDNIGADYIGAWQPAGGGAGVVVPQGLHGIETGIIA